MTTETSNIVKLKCQRFSIDWTYEIDKEIDLDKYAYFSAEYRLGNWHLVGHYCIEETHKWRSEELSEHWCYLRDIAEFIVKANKYQKDKTKGYQGCKVSKFNSMHYEEKFYQALQELLNVVKRLESEATE